MAVVNQTFVKRYFPAGDVIGHSFKVPDLKAQPPYFFVAPGAENGLLIVGVVGDKLDEGLSKPIGPEVFVPYTVAMGMYTQLLVRSEVPPLSLLHTVRTAVNSIDPDQQTNDNVRDLEHWISRMPE